LTKLNKRNAQGPETHRISEHSMRPAESVNNE